MNIKEPIGFIGLGNMGSGMAKNLLANGYFVRGFDVDGVRLESLQSSAFIPAKNTDNIIFDCEIVILCLPNPDVSREVIFEKLLNSGSKINTIIETSTLTPEVVTEFSKSLESKGVAFLSAPMIGGKNHAEKGTTKFLIEGSRDTYDKLLHLFKAMGSQEAYVGYVPSATLAKIAFNISRYANLAVGVETHRLLKKYDADIPAIYEFMREESLDNFGQVWCEDLEEMMKHDIPFKPSSVPAKDLSLFSEMANLNSLDSGLIDAVRNSYLSMEDKTNASQ